MSKILLPAKGVPWQAFNQNQEGLQRITPDLFEGRLYTFDNVKSSGVPSLFAHPFVFSKRLERDNTGQSAEFKQFSAIIKGIFLGVVEIKKIPIANLAVLGQVASGFQAGMNSFAMLTWRKKTNGQWNEHIIGGLYPECLAFPGVRVIQPDRNGKTLLDDIELENTEREKSFGADAIRGHFKQWVDQVTAPLLGGNLPLWANKLLQMTNAGGVWDSSLLNVAALPALASRSLQLETVDVSNGNAIISIPLVRYIDHLLVCQNNGAAVKINLSKHDVSLELGPDKNIICTRLDDKSRVCGHNCQIDGIGPNIEEEGFFERQPGEYIIWKDFEEASLPRGCTDVKYFDDHAFFTFGNLQVKINGKVLSREDIFCESVIKFDNGKMPELPIKSEYLDCIENVSRQDRHTTYDMELKGIGKKITYAPKVIDGDKASILLWPSFKDPAWKVNYAFFYPSPILEGKNPTIRLINIDNGNMHLLSDVNKFSGCKIDSPVTHIEVFIKENRIDKPIGVFRDNRPNVQSAVDMAIPLALDFGTTNTSLAIKLEMGGQQSSHQVLDLTDAQSFDILEYYMVKDRIHAMASWLPAYIPDGELILSSTPSELIFVDSSAKHPNNLNAPIFKYSIPHPNYNLPLAHKSVVLNFKWSAPHPFTGREGDTSKAYLKMILHMALATLRIAPYFRNNVLFIATYPLAFGLSKYADYKTLLRTLIEELQRETGMVITWSNVALDNDGSEALIPESHAGKARFRTEKPQLVVDIGGGTTDIVLSVSDKILAVDSIEYAGNTYIDFLINNFPDGLISQSADDRLKIDNSTPDEKKKEILNERKIILNKEIRRNGLRGVIAAYNNDNRRQNIAISKLESFYNGIFEYLYLLLEGYEIRDDITFYPIGNAWEFTDAIPNSGGVDAYINGWFSQKIRNLHVISPRAFTRKGAVATGALILADGRNFMPPDLRHPVNSVVGCDVIISGRSINKTDLIPFDLDLRNENNPPTISVGGFIDTLEWQPKDQISTHTIALMLTRMVEERAIKFENGQWRLTKSLFVIFLENIFPKYFL